MRIVHLSTIHRPLDIRIFYKECVTLVKAGHEVHLLVSHPPTDELAGVYFHAIDRVTNYPRLERIWRRLRSAYDLAVSLQADIYHFHDPELILVGILLKRLGAKVIYDVHEDTPWEAISLSKENPLIGWVKFGIWTVLEGIAQVSLDAFVCVTPQIAEKFPSGKTNIVRNFPLTAELEECASVSLDYAARANNVVYAGGIAVIRAIREMVLAIALVPENLAAKLVVLGEFSSPALQAEIEDYSGWQRVEFLGWRSRHDVVQHLAQAKVGLIILHPERSFLDSLPIKLFEYMAAGLPIIASDFPLWRHLIEDIGCGILVNPLDPQEIAQAIEYLLENPDLAAVMGKKGQAAVRTQYNWEIEAEKLLNLYHKIYQQ